MYVRPDAAEKLALMADATRFEPAGDRPQAETRALSRRKPTPEDRLQGALQCIAHVTTPTGQMPVLKAMVTTACEKNCYYCPFRAGRGKMDRIAFQPDELAHTFDQIQRAGLVKGIFLSSGVVNGGVSTQDKIIDTIEIIRRKYGYQGYIHLKIMPGAEYDQLFRAMQIADRVSINLEAPTAERLHALAPKKDFDGELLERLHWSRDIRQQHPGLVRASTVTQFVVGAVGDTDLELLSLSARLYRQLGLTRAYYSGFNPVEENAAGKIFLPPIPCASGGCIRPVFLLRDYLWDVEDFPFLADGNLRLDVDPKRAWADLHLSQSPVDVMRASRADLLRVPGIGPRGADAILKARRKGRLSDLAHLSKLGIHAQWAAPYILLDGRRPPLQLPLFGDS